VAAVAKQQCSKHVPAAINQHVTEELVEVVLSVISVKAM
jgi:hypothetical protein